MAKQLPRNTGQGNPPTTTIPGPSTPQQGQLPNDQQIQDSLSLLLSNPLYASLFSTEQKISALGVPGNKVVDKLTQAALYVMKVSKLSVRKGQMSNRSITTMTNTFWLHTVQNVNLKSSANSKKRTILQRNINLAIR